MSTQAEATGRPKALDDALKLEICERVAGGETVRVICEDERMPAASTVYLELAADAGFSEQYARSREAQLIMWEDELVEIADDATNDFVKRQRGEEEVDAVNHDHIARSKVRIDTRKWLMAKRMPKKYGDRVMNELSGPEGGPIQTEDVTDETRARRLALLFASAAAAREAAPSSEEGAE